MTSASTHPAQTDATADGSRAGSGSSGAVGSGAVGSGAAASGVTGSGAAEAGPGTPEGSGGSKNNRGPTARIWIARVWAVLWRGLAFVLLLLLFFLAGVLLALRNENVQAWIKDEVNAVLAASAAESGLHIRLTNLSGALPFTAQVGVEVADDHGLWLDAPHNTFVWDWAALPGRVRIAELISNGPRLLRLPDLPPSAPEPPSPPLTEASLREMLGGTVRTISSLPGWLPDVLLDRVAVVDAQLPASLLGALPPADTTADAKADAATDSGADAKADAKPDAKPDVPANAPTAGTPDRAKGQASPTAALPAANLADASLSAASPPPDKLPPDKVPPEKLSADKLSADKLSAASPPPDKRLTDSYFLATVEASLRAGSAGGKLTALLTAHGANNAPLPLPGASSGGLEARLEVNFAPRRSGTVTPSALALTVDSTLEATVLPAGHAGAAQTDPSAGTDAQAGQAIPAATPATTVTGTNANGTATASAAVAAPSAATTVAGASSTPATTTPATASGTSASAPAPTTIAAPTTTAAQGMDNWGF